ncbi:hypothetical protein Tco_0926201 [Tanacetum coccineum]|uniref:Uncharacterized protein n=1 Tax=Tanacetum coccineum TaxID=301880 RepID=A0ABQ5DAA5_9ASTR
MTTTAAQQVPLDNVLVPLEKRVEIGKCNMRIDPAKTLKEPTYQVEIGKIDMEVFIEIFQICPRLSNKDFDELPSDDEIVSFIKEFDHKGDIKSVSEVSLIRCTNHEELLLKSSTSAYLGKLRVLTSFDFQEFKIYGECSIRRRTLVTEEEEEPEPAKKAVSSKKPATKRQSAGVRIRDTPGVSVSKKKALTKAERSKGIELLSEAALLEEAQLKKALRRRKQDTTIHQASGSKEETQDDEYVHTHNDYVPTVDETKDEKDDVTKEEYERINEELYGDVNVGNQVKDDAQATQKTKGPILSSSISSDYAAKYLNFDNIPSVDTEVVSMLDINVQQEVPQAITLTNVAPDSETLSAFHQRIINLEKDVKELKTVDHSASLLSTIKSEVPNAVKKYFGTSLDDALYKVLKKHNADIIKEHSVLAEIDEDAIDEGVADKLKKRKQDDVNKDEGPSVGSDRGLKRRKTSKDTEPSKKAKSTETSKGTSKSHLKSIDKSAQAEETVFEAGDTQEPQNQGQDMGNTDDQPNVKAVSKHDWFKKPERPPNPDLDWNVRKLVDFRGFQIISGVDRL